MGGDSRPDRCGSVAAGHCWKWNTRGFFEQATAGDVMGYLETGATVTARDKDGVTPLHWAAEWSEDVSVLEVLLDAGAAIDTQTAAGATPLHHAARRNADHHSILKVLLNAGAAVGARDEHGFSPLHWMARTTRSPGTLEILLDGGAAGADLQARTRFGKSPLHDAVWSADDPDVIAALLDAGTPPDAKDDRGKVPWEHAEHLHKFKGHDVLRRLNEGRSQLSVEKEPGTETGR